jgi:AAA+ superfamily predicted ATPase
MDPNFFPNMTNIYNPYVHIANLEKQVYLLTVAMGCVSDLQQKVNDLTINLETLKTTNKIIDIENKEFIEKVKYLEEVTLKLKKSENYRKRQDKKRKKEEMKKMEEDEEEEEYNDNIGEEKKSNEAKEMDTFVDNLLSGILSGKSNGPIKGNIIIDMKTGKIVDSQFGPKSESKLNQDAQPFTPLSDLFNKLLNKPKSKTENINNDENEAETQYDFSMLEKYEVQNIDSNLNNIKDVIELSKKFPLENKGESKLEKIDGLYEYDGKYYGINIEILNKLAKPLERLNKMIGLDKIKTQILEMILYYMQEFEKGTSNMLHTIIEGPPGVGKTELGKIFAEIYSSLGIIPSAKFKLVKRTDLIGEYVGHTSHKTQNAIDEAEGGVLFIDEAYALGGSSEKSDSFSKECLDVLNQNLSENKKKLIVIIAGYKDQLESSFFSYNPGLKRRFPFKYSIEGYSPEEIKDIYLKKLNDINWKIDKSITDKFIVEFFTKNKDEFKCYGGDIENLLLNSKFVHSKRVFNEHPYKRKILNKADFESAFERFKTNKKKKDNEDFPHNIYI